MLLAVFGAGCASLPLQPNAPIEPSAAVDDVSVDVSGKGLAAFPMDVLSRTKLERLDLSKNKLTGAPPSQIGQLTHLKYLDLSGNALTGLPAELGALNTLEVLIVSNNKLTGLPMEIGNLTQLKLLDVSGNPYSVQDLEGIAERLPQTIIRR